MTSTEDDSTHFYGYCLFRQQRDPSAKRSYRQTALTLVSQNGYTPLFSHIVKTMTLLEGEISPTLIESACSNIAAWGAPEVGMRELPFLGEILEVHMFVYLLKFLDLTNSFKPTAPSFPTSRSYVCSSYEKRSRL